MGKLVGERRALAAAVVAFYMSIYFLVAIQAPEGWAAAFGALAGLYGAAFVGLVAGYFWARWFAIGLGISGMIAGILSLWQVGAETMLIFYTVSHALASIVLWGNSMAGFFDGRKEWRERYHLDESATHRLGKSVIRVGVSLPYIVLYALAPREGGAALALLGGAAVAAGAWGLFRMRTWGLIAVTAGVGALALSLPSSPALVAYAGSSVPGYLIDVAGFGLAGSVIAAAAVVPFLAPAARFVAKSRS